MPDTLSVRRPEALEEQRRHAVRIGHERIVAPAEAPVIHERPLPHRICFDDLAGGTVLPELIFSQSLRDDLPENAEIGSVPIQKVFLALRLQLC